MFYPHQVKSFDALGQEIPELSGPYTPELREAIKAASDDKTVEQDVTQEWIRERYRTTLENALKERWKPQLEDTIGGWCCTVESVPGTPADGNPPIVDFATEEVARHVAELHNDWLADETEQTAPLVQPPAEST